MAMQRLCCCRLKLACLIIGVLTTVVLAIYSALWIQADVEFYQVTEITSVYIVNIMKTDYMEVFVQVLLSLDLFTLVALIMMVAASQRDLESAVLYVPFLTFAVLSCLLTLTFMLLTTNIVIFKSNSVSEDDVDLSVLTVVYIVIGLSRFIPLVLAIMASVSRLMELRSYPRSGTHALVPNDNNRSRQEQSQLNVTEWWNKSRPDLHPPSEISVTETPQTRSAPYVERVNSFDTTTIDGGSVPQFYSTSLIKENIQPGQLMGLDITRLSQHSYTSREHSSRHNRNNPYSVPGMTYSELALSPVHTFQTENEMNRHSSRKKRNKKSRKDKKSDRNRAKHHKNMEFPGRSYSDLSGRSYRSLDRRSDGPSYIEPYYHRSIPRPRYF